MVAFGMRFLIPILVLALALLPGAAVAQALPNHVDPSARDTAPDLSAVPAIRFLTTTDFPPFNYRDETGALVGFNIDLARAICTELKVVCTMQAWPWEQAAEALADNQGDALAAGLAITPENGKKFDFSHLYLELPARFVTLRPKVKGFSPQELAGKAVAVRKGSTHETFLTRYLPGAKPVEFASEAEALDAVAAGKAEAYFGDAMRASFWLNSHLDCCDFAGDPYFRPDLFGEGLAFALPAGRDAVRAALNYALVHLKRNGTFDQLYLRWFPVSFY